jgi:hypothetical protein
MLLEVNESRNEWDFRYSILVSRRPARKVVDHDGGFMRKTSKNNSKITSYVALVVLVLGDNVT